MNPLCFSFPFTDISFSITFVFLLFLVHLLFFLFRLNVISVSCHSFPFLCVSISFAFSCYPFPFLSSFLPFIPLESTLLTTDNCETSTFSTWAGLGHFQLGKQRNGRSGKKRKGNGSQSKDMDMQGNGKEWKRNEVQGMETQLAMIWANMSRTWDGDSPLQNA